MKVLIVGSGGREHALAWKLKQSPRLTQLVCAPGNPGMQELGAQLLAGPDEKHTALIAWCAAERPDLVVIGPEGPLASGLADQLAAMGIAVFGPSQAAAQLESSKSFCKAFCARRAIPTAGYAVFDDAPRAKAHLAGKEPPFVIKADGLAGGKGVIVAQSFMEADAAIDEIMFLRKFGSAGNQIIIEEFLPGEEVSLFAISDGENALFLGAAQDHKRAFDGDRGPNTGGMGAYSPAPIMTPALIEEVMHTIIMPTVTGMHAEGTPFRGILFAGLMISGGQPRLIEFNVRFGDPECQTLLPLLEEDLLELLAGAAAGKLRGRSALRWRPQASATIVMAAQGYPDSPLLGSVLRGVQLAAQHPGVNLFHAGTRRDEDGALRAAGGRVLNINATAATLPMALDRAYAAAREINWPGGFYRTDIGWRGLE